MKLSLESNIHNLSWPVLMLTMISCRVRAKVYARLTAEYLNQYDNRKRLSLFCYAIITSYELLRAKKIHVLDYADEVNAKLDSPVYIDSAFNAEMIRGAANVTK